MQSAHLASLSKTVFLEMTKSHQYLTCIVKLVFCRHTSVRVTKGFDCIWKDMSFNFIWKWQTLKIHSMIPKLPASLEHSYSDKFSHQNNNIKQKSQYSLCRILKCKQLANISTYSFVSSNSSSHCFSCSLSWEMIKKYLHRV